MAEITYPAPAAEQSQHVEIRETNEAKEIFERDNKDETVAVDSDDESSQLSDKTLANLLILPRKRKARYKVLQRKLSWKK